MPVCRNVADPDEGIRTLATRLGRLGIAARGGAHAAMTLSEDHDARPGRAATEPGRVDAIATLSAALQDPDQGVRMVAAGCVEDVGPAAERLVSSLTDALTDVQPIVRANAASALGAIGRAARPALAALKKAQKDSESSVRDAASAALSRVGE